MAKKPAKLDLFLKNAEKANELAEMYRSNDGLNSQLLHGSPINRKNSTKRIIQKVLQL